MKKILLLATLFASSFFVATAQEDVNKSAADESIRNEKIYPLYVAYVTKELNLTTEEAQKFWPVHTQFENELRSVSKDLPELKKEEARLNIKKKYQSNFTSILGATRFERFIRMNANFKRKLMERLQKKRQNGIRPGLRRDQ